MVYVDVVFQLVQQRNGLPVVSLLDRAEDQLIVQFSHFVVDGFAPVGWRLLLEQGAVFGRHLQRVTGVF
jgi:hypothetical protein